MSREQGIAIIRNRVNCLKRNSQVRALCFTKGGRIGFCEGRFDLKGAGGIMRVNMPTFFGRRYMRDKPGRTERTLGAALLVFVAVVALTFAMTTGVFGKRAANSNLSWAIKSVCGISDEPLFTVDRSKIKPPDSRELRIAKAMLPFHKRVYRKPMFVSLDSNSREYYPTALVVAARAYGAKQFIQSSRKGCIEINIVDLGSPENAFGLWRSREPAGAKRLSIGRGGWVFSKDHTIQIAFWAGRYYTQLEDWFPENSPGELEAAARAVADKQLVWGGPFWAESVLPAEGRIEGSLRFVKGDPLAMSMRLGGDYWQADYVGGVTIGVMKLPADKREAVSAAIKGAGELSASVGEMPAVKGMPAGAVCVAGEGKALLACPAGEYVFIVSGPDAQALVSAAKPLVERWSAAKTEAVAAASAAAVKPAAGGKTETPAGAARFGDPGDAEILVPTAIERYTDNLYEKIDGREPQFRQFGFVELRVGQYKYPPMQAVYDAYIFDMGEPVNAMGIYMTERSGDPHAIKIGRDGYVSGASVYFWKSKYYVYILGPADAGEEATEVAEKIARAIDKTIADSQEPFWAEKLLPTEDRLPDSLSYRASSGLGFDFLKRMFVTSYKTGDQTYQMYILREESPAAAKALFEKFAEATAKYDKVLSKKESPGGETLVSESLGVYGSAFYKGIYFGGVAECADRTLAETKAGMLRDSLPEK